MEILQIDNVKIVIQLAIHVMVMAHVIIIFNYYLE